ncbi:hypothetical protein Tco_0905017 [Tanacetum coccineum]
MRIFFSYNSDRLAAIARDVLDSVDERVITSASSYSFTVLSNFGKILETCALNLVLMASCILLVREELGIIVGVGTGVCCICVMRGVSGGGRVVANTRGGSAIVVTGTSTSEVALVLRQNI